MYFILLVVGIILNFILDKIEAYLLAGEQLQDYLYIMKKIHRI